MSAKKTKPNFTTNKAFKKKTSSNKTNLPTTPTPSKKQDSRKVHDTKGKNNHGRSPW